MGSNEYSVIFYHIETQNLHTVFPHVMAPDEDTALEIGKRKFANYNGYTPDEYYKASVRLNSGQDETVADSDAESVNADAEPTADERTEN